ncbi:uncharacterized protein LOC119738740 [Patiria miniata]|uniref:CAAX prenyl protease 2/Lysostaphin resistance protein A-like domain-containing protein n=1 Tax=Patiria miniata TaxID=46514 RepID=A0A914AZM1_PATMI|nr:uncharacterized protein LOC119738740 [Patiria miniata]
MAGFGTCLNFAFVTLFVTTAWVFLGRNLSFGTLSVAMYFPTVFALLFKFASGEFFEFVSQTFGTLSAPPTETYFSVATACLISVAITALTLCLCVALNLSMGWGKLAKRDVQDDQRSSEVKKSMSRREIWGFLRASGEEVGWRCFLLPCLVEMYSPADALAISGVIWGLYHVAIMILLTYRLKVDRQVTTVVIQCVSVFLNAYPHGWITMRSGYSVWPSAVMHFTWNVLNPWVLGSIYTHKPGLIIGDQWLINGEGLAGCIVIIPVAFMTMKDLAG